MRQPEKSEASPHRAAAPRRIVAFRSGRNSQQPMLRRDQLDMATEPNTGRRAKPKLARCGEKRASQWSSQLGSSHKKRHRQKVEETRYELRRASIVIGLAPGVRLSGIAALPDLD